MITFKKAAVILATLLTAAVGVAVVAAPAQAATPTCPLGMICWFDGSNWEGARKYVVNPDQVIPGRCYNMGYDPGLGIQWNDAVDSVWWNHVGSPNTYVEFYEGYNCTISAITRSKAWLVVSDQKQSCMEARAIWDGPCFTRPGTPKRISSWAFRF